jgi:hypothetical protein
MTPALPKPVADYVEANARLDVDGMLKPLAADALVRAADLKTLEITP